MPFRPNIPDRYLPAVAPDDTAGAKARAKYFHAVDPFPDLSPALLSSEHIADYVRTTALLHPFYPEPDRLKPASYEARARLFIRWDESGRKSIVRKSADGRPYTLPANSITFALIESKVRLPNYIAIRFNLRIKHVHRGLLLGTGPLVDPGFSGNLLIPLHNLTSDPYDISWDEGLIWIEFTKTSHVSAPVGPGPLKLEVHKLNVDYETYFERASGNNPIRSSIPQAIKEARDRSNAAERAARDARRTVGLLAGVGIVAIAGTALAIDLALHSYFGQMITLVDGVHKDALQAGADSSKALEENADLRKALASANQRLDELRTEMDHLSNDLRQSRSQQPRNSR